MQTILYTEGDQVWTNVRGYVVGWTVLTILALLNIHSALAFAVMAFFSLAFAVYLKSVSEPLEYQGIRNVLMQISVFLIFVTTIFVASTTTRLTGLIWLGEGGISLRTTDKIIVSLILGFTAWRLAAKYLDLSEVQKLAQQQNVKKSL